MTERLRKTVRSFLRKELPSSPGEAVALVRDWFGRYDPDPSMLEEEVERHFVDHPPQDGTASWGRPARARGEA